jgi:hypothetical protein
MAQTINTHAQTAITAPQDKPFIVQFTFAGSAASGTTVTGTMYPYGYQNPSQTTFQVPAGSGYQLFDTYVNGTPQVDGQLIFTVNGVVQGENLTISSLNSQVSGRVKPSQQLLLRPMDTFSVQLISLAANTLTTSNTDTVVLHFIQVPQ